MTRALLLVFCASSHHTLHTETITLHQVFSDCHFNYVLAATFWSFAYCGKTQLGTFLKDVVVCCVNVGLVWLSFPLLFVTL